MADKDSKQVFQQKLWLAISNFLKEPSSQDPNQPVNYWYSEKIDVRTDPHAPTLLPATQKESGGTVTDLVKWADITPANLVVYSYGNTGNIYSRTSAGSWSNLHNTSSSHGNGLQYFYGDDYVYYTGDSAVGRYGPAANTPIVLEDWNTNVINSNLWTDRSSGHASASTGRLIITNPANNTSYPSVKTVTTYNLTGKRFFTQLVDAGNQALASFTSIFFTSIRDDENNKLFIGVGTNNVYAYKIISGVQTEITHIAYSSTNHKYLSISESNGTISFETSPDGVIFNAFATLANPFGITNMQFACQVGTYSNEASSTTGTFDNFGYMLSTGSAVFSDDFLTAQGGVPQNTYSLALVAASSQSADAADSASLSVTGDLTLEAYFYLNSLPAIGSSMTLAGKWDESGVLRSYIMDIYGVSGYFGDGSDGALTIAADTTEAPIDSTCTGTSGSYALFATNGSFAIGQQILIHQSQRTGAGQAERNVISGYTAGTITLQSPLTGSYGTGAQVRVLKQYTNVTINSGKTYTAKAWNGTVGGILAFLANGTVTVAGSISATGKGFRGASQISGSDVGGKQGEGTAGAADATSISANGNGGGGGGAGSGLDGGAGGGAGGNALLGYSGGTGQQTSGIGGSASGSSDLTTITFGGGGGSGSAGRNGSNIGYAGGIGGGIVFITGVTVTITGSILSSGDNGSIAVTDNGGGGGGGGGGSILIKAQTATLGTSLINVEGGVGGSAGSSSGGNRQGGNGSVGRIHLDYLTSFTGSTSPTLNSTQDNTLVTTATYQARIGISQNGTASEYLTKNLSSLTTAQWNRLSITWTSASSLAAFYLNGNSLGTATGTKTAISDNASLLYIGANKGASVIQNYLNGYIDDVRVWGVVRSSSDIASFTNHQLTGNEANLKAYYKLNSAATDATTNANNLTLRNAPSYTTAVPFVDPTTRLDIDQSFTTTGSTYTLPTSISEATADQLPFTPANDPQKSVDVSVDTKGTGDWTITIHDQQNNTIASKTITNANMASGGYQEFIWSTAWRIVIGKSYHMHISVSTGTSKIVSSSLNTLQSAGVATGNFHTYFQFLVTDVLFHPISRMLNFLVIGNERYLAKWDGAFFYPNYLAFPAGTHIRCFGYWGKYLAIGTWQEASSGSPTIYDFPTGRIYFWDGISLTFNFSIEVPEGQVNALYGMDANLYYFAGYKADLMMYNGGDTTGNSQGQKIKRIPYLERSKYVEIYPQAMAMHRGLLHFGIGGNTNSTALPQGVYAWGTLYPQYAESLSFDHIISTGNKGSSAKIGMIYPVGQKLLVSWQDGIANGVDVIDPTGSVYYTSGLIQTNIQDGGMVYANDLLLKVRADHLTLASGEGIEVGYKLDRASSFTTTNSITDAVTNKFTANMLTSGRVTEYQLQVKLTGNGTSSPTLLSLAALTDTLVSEAQQL